MLSRFAPGRMMLGASTRWLVCRRVGAARGPVVYRPAGHPVPEGSPSGTTVGRSARRESVTTRCGLSRLEENIDINIEIVDHGAVRFGQPSEGSRPTP